MADNDSDKTEQATERHLGEAMEQGRFAKVPELSLLFMLLTAAGILAMTAQTAADRMFEFSTATFSEFASVQLRSDTVTALFTKMMAVGGAIVLPVACGCALAAALAGGLQTGFRLTPKVVGLNWSKLDLGAGVGRLFSKGTLVHTAIDALKLVAIGGSVYVGARALVHDPLFSSPVETAYLGRFLVQAATSLISRLTLSLGVVAAISFTYERFKTSRELMMTKQEVKDERRNNEGDGLVKNNRRRLARRLMQKQMLAAVATADVIVTNPTHYAVALKYERGRDRAPVVLAKGENRFALRIKALGAEHQVPMVENRPVARLLFGLGRVGESIPPELYQAVAQILALVYRTHRYYFHRLKARRLELVN